MIATSLVFLALLGAKRFLKRQYVYIYMHIYNISYLKRETESICVIGGTVDYVSLFARVQVLCIMICVCMFLSQSI